MSTADGEHVVRLPGARRRRVTPGLERMLLSPEEAAQVLGISRAMVYELLAAGRLPSIKLGRCRRIPMESVRRLVGSWRESA